ncbi:MAG: hypothetical protein M1832_003895 [Thelocarpon impressellum]|nr:MAG: hypothetical protein M1832_003895 [Thelocarpon impressellum]
MSLNPQVTHAPSKSAGNTPSQTPSSSQLQSYSSLSLESQTPRRGGNPAASGATSAARNIQASGRHNQSLRKQHRGQKKPRLADEDAMAESAAVKSANSRKGQTSITHLMNFALPPRPQLNQSRSPYGRNGRRNPTWGLGSGHHAVDKARYVHANYRFMVDPRGDYHAQAADADVHLDWSSILQVLASAQTQCSACPICLSTPVAPRMAKCGHIFCLPCLIRYMHSTDDTSHLPEKRARWKKCPICWDSIYISDTRPVRWFIGQEGLPPREAEDVVLRLVMRQQGSTLALPRDGADALAKTEGIPWHIAAEVADYARVMKASEDYMMEQFNIEIDQLRYVEREDELIYGDEPEWTKKAVGAIREAKERVKGIGNPPSLPKERPEKKVKRAPIKFDESDEDVPEMYMVQHAARAGQSLPQPQAPSSFGEEDADVRSTSQLDARSEVDSATQVASSASALHRSRGQGNDPDNSVLESPYFFYQALLHYYLSPLDIRILKAAFGSYDSFPTKILPHVERVSTGHIVDDDLRKRAKYLAHLPQGCEVCFLECDWTDLVAPEILERFKFEIERRRKRNQEKEVREEKERVRAEREEEDKRWAAARRKRPSISHDRALEDALRASEVAVQATSSLDICTTSASPPWPSSRGAQQGSAFASLASPSTSPVAPRTVWGTAAIAPVTPPTQAEPHLESDVSDNDGWLHDWERDLLHDDDALAAQVAAASIGGEGGTSYTAAGGGGGKKKKGKKITLMTTTARRGA